MKTATDKGTQTSLDKRLLKVLLVEDEATDRMSVERILRTCSSPVGFVIESVATLSEAIRNLAEKKYDAILLDLALPDSSGIETVRQTVKVAPDIPVVVLTELEDEQTSFSALEDGATDYLVKDLPLDVVLVRTIVYALHRKKIQMQSLKLAHDINERMKELNCLYGISKLVETPGISLEEILEKTVCLIPASWQYPGIACAKIVIGDSEFRTKNFTESAWKQSAPIKVYGSVMGKIEVGYLEERPELDDGPFLKEERLLIDAIAERLGHITERKKAEETQKRLVALIEVTTDFVGFADAKDKHLIYVNKAGRKMCGIGNDEDVTKLKISDVHPEWTNKMFAEEILPAAVRDGVWTGECAFLNIRDRHEIPVLMVLSSHKASNGEVEVFSTISRDITERKQAEKTLRESEERYKNLFKANIDGILIADATTKKFRYANPAICRMLGYSEEEFMQMGVADIHPKESLEQVNTEFKAQTSGAKINADLQCVRKDGQVISVSINAGTVMIDQTKYLMGIFRDITERKNKEKLILDANRRLEKVSEELSAAKRDLEQKNEALQKTCSELEQRVKEQTAQPAAAK
ncbi:MAG: PAS domain S-box protein [Sedimentisphaerales bacterium]|nr:PAS domain S-box protein [Sedimentisphaerales bacterium]